MALATKYKDKAVERRVKPKPPPYKPPPAKDYSADTAKDKAESKESKSKWKDSDDDHDAPGGDDDSYPDPPKASQSDPLYDPSKDDAEFDSALADLLDKKKAAVEGEDYDGAAVVKD